MDVRILLFLLIWFVVCIKQKKKKWIILMILGSIILYIIYLVLDYLVRSKQITNPNSINLIGVYSLATICIALLSFLIFCFLEIKNWISNNFFGNTVRENMSHGKAKKNSKIK